MPTSALHAGFDFLAKQRFALGLVMALALLGDDWALVQPASAADKAAAETDKADEMAEARKALGPLQSFVGAWKGAGQTKRGSTDGAWREEADWSWDYSDKKVAVVFKADLGKVYSSGRITPGDDEETFKLVAMPPGEGVESETFTGKFDDEERITFTADEPSDGRPAEIVMRLVAKGRRMVMIYQRQSAATGGKSFMAEVGFSRKGSNFGRDDNLPECVLTGGEASIAVEHEGKTYYVCCTGCRDYFIEHPEKVLAEYKARLEKRKMKEAETGEKQ
jgi:YHS domain-containing protein